MSDDAKFNAQPYPTKKKKQKRKRGSSSSKPKTEIVSRIFNNYSFALSTIDTEKQFEENKRKRSKHWDKDGKLIPEPEAEAEPEAGSPSASPLAPTQHTFQSLSSLLLSNGCLRIIETISPKSLHCLITTSSARSSLTQKIRKSYKRNVRIVDVAWVDECLKMNKVVPLEPYRCESRVKNAIEQKEKEKQNEVVDVQFVEEAEDEGWSAPISFGCSCVCHENHAPGTLTDCAWCPHDTCSINLNLCRTTA